MDVIVCYDCSASPTRSVQRTGRTGRHKEGRVVYLLSEGKEEADYARIQEVRAIEGKEGASWQLARTLFTGGGCRVLACCGCQGWLLCPPFRDAHCPLPPQPLLYTTSRRPRRPPRSCTSS